MELVSLRRRGSAGWTTRRVSTSGEDARERQPPAQDGVFVSPDGMFRSRQARATATGSSTRIIPPAMAPETDVTRTAAANGARDAQMPPARIGRYVIEGTLGAGGMGIVYAGYDADLDRRVAIKVLRRSTTAESEARVRLLREARAMAKLPHPNVITVHEVGTDGGTDFVAMELIDGSNVVEWRAETRPSRAEILRVFHAAGQGLAAAHEAGLVHRDFKPHNVLVGRDGRVVVTDFGLARAAAEAGTERAVMASDSLASGSGSQRQADAADAPPIPVSGLADTIDAVDSGSSLAEVCDRGRDLGSWTDELTRTGAVLGTPAYMSPEQARGQTVDYRTDLFSLGSVLCAMCTGHPPFTAAGSLTVLSLVANDEPTPIQEINPDVPSFDDESGLVYQNR